MIIRGHVPDTIIRFGNRTWRAKSPTDRSGMQCSHHGLLFLHDPEKRPRGSAGYAPALRYGYVNADVTTLSDNAVPIEHLDLG